MLHAACSFLLALAPPVQGAFRSDWSLQPDRVFIGAEYWANRLQDWRIEDGAAVCVAPGRLRRRTLHVLARDIESGTTQRWSACVAVSRAAGEGPAPDASAGFLIGVGDGEMDWRAAAVVHGPVGPGFGLWCGVDGEGRLFVRDPRALPDESLARSDSAVSWDGLVRLSVSVQGGPEASVIVAARDESGSTLAETACRRSIPAGGLALISDAGSQAGDEPHGFRFTDLVLEGQGLAAHPDRTFGPIASCQYAVSRGVLKLTAQLLPVEVQAVSQPVLEVDRGEGWQVAATAEIVVPGWTATFRVPGWDASRDVPYRVTLAETLRDGSQRAHAFPGTIRRDPIERDRIVVAGFTGNHNNSHAIGGGWGLGQSPGRTAPNDWIHGMWFPHADLVAQVRARGPDLLFFSGDQVYEGKSPTFADTANIDLDYLYKWYLWCWAWRDLTRSIPSVAIPDDHDVYQGNVWGQGGRKAPAGQNSGGYVHPASFVNLVHRTQTSWLPDPADPTPIGQGIAYYTTDLVWGGISFAVIADRMFKTGPKGNGLPPSGTGREDWFNDPELDTRDLDLPELELLGARQLAFLRAWSRDWRGAEMKVALSQTAFANLATHHGPELRRLIADLDSNGWPQSGRNRALAELRRALAVHLCGDQHLATLCHHGIERHGDSIWSFCVPSVANFYPRAFAPECGEPYERPVPAAYQGDREDGFHNLITVAAAANPGRATGLLPADLYDRMPGYGVLVLDKAARTVTFECWPRGAAAVSGQYPGWPLTVHQLDNGLAHPAGFLPEVTSDFDDPVVEVFDEASGDLVYSLRIRGRSFRPPVREPGSYTVRIGSPERGAWRQRTGLVPR